MAFDLNNLKQTFDGRIAKLADAERIVREELRTLSVDVLYAVHEHGNIEYVNKLILAPMTPMNRAKLVEFFKEFVGFHFDKDTKQFTKKDKSVYESKQKAFVLAMEADAQFNFWTWATAEKDPVKGKAFELSQVTEATIKFVKKAEKANIEKVEVLKAVIGAGFTPADLAAVLEAMLPKEQEKLAA